jgi:metallo-beta-lactamase class B
MNRSRKALALAFLSSVFILVADGPLRAQNPAEWTESFPPHKVAGNIYYVGSKGLAAFLITTPQGHILINSNLQESVPQIQASVEKLGFHFSDVKILLISHAHFDHCAGSAKIKELTGARYMVMDADVPVVESGGKNDFQYGGSKNSWYPGARVDRLLHDGDQVRLGDTVLVAHLTPGHTKGTTTWTMKVRDGGKILDVVIVGSPNVNPGYKLVHNAAYPNIALDYERTFRVLNALPCDVFLGAHGGYYDMEAKFARLKQGTNPFLDPDGYKSYVADREQAFRAELKKQSAANQYNIRKRSARLVSAFSSMFCEKQIPRRARDDNKSLLCSVSGEACGRNLRCEYAARDVKKS